LGGGGEGKRLTILSYNVHNLFDAKDDGTEYPEFSVAKGRWDEGRYRARLTSIGEAVAAALPEGKWPDVLCLEEVENEAALRDLAAGPLKAAGYAQLGMACAPGSPINSGILSRRPILSLKAHGLAAEGARAKAASKAARASAPPRASGRSLLEARIDLGEGATLALFVVHWKSKVEGAEATEAGRREAAALLADRVARILEAEPGAAIVACGDFNESPDEYLRVGRRYPTALMPEAEALVAASAGPRLLVAAEPARAGLRPCAEGGRPEPALYSPWAESPGYSYSYKGSRERLDGFLLSPGLLDRGGLDLSSFSPVDAPFLVDAAGEPVAWSPATPGGHSDHLPVLLVLEDPAAR
jgi:endonuclease/exonuclease/phosphatase family metal-dependent hydrolase